VPDIPLFPPLFKQTADEGVQTWEIRVEPNDDGTATIITTHGRLDGKKQEARDVIREGKNPGKKNATTALQQAVKEAAAKHKERLTRKHYALEVGDSAASRAAAPMLAKVFAEHIDKVTWDNAYTQPKLDGYRCLARRQGDEISLVSREGLPIQTMPHIVEALRSVLPDGATFDGELYSQLAFENLSSLIKRAQPDSAKISYYVYDMVADAPFIQRYDTVARHIRRRGAPCLVTVGTQPVRSADELLAFRDNCIAEGLEGAMLRYGDAGYHAGKRSANLLKAKKFKDDEFQVIGAKEGRGTYAGMAIFVCVTPAGHEFDVTAPGPLEEKRRYWQERDLYVGKKLTVEYQDFTKTETPVPRFPTAKRFA
jgi:DNA ligase-1